MNYADMSAKKLLETLNDVDEQDTLEAKSLRDDTSRSILETICSFSNEPGLGGGVIVIGIAESKNADGTRYVVDGVDDPDKAQLDLATQCKSAFNTPIYPTIKVEKLCGKTVLKVIVDEVPFGRKPVYFKKDGLPKGAYRRIGSADLVATEEDLWRFYEDPESKYDETPVKYSSLADVDERAVQRYRQMRKRVDPEAVELEYETPELLAALGCTNKENPKELNMAGMLLFGNELAIKRACARARVDYIRILGNDWHAVADQFDAVDTYAPIFLMVDKLMSIIYGELTTRHRFHRDSIQPETEKFPVEVMREALVNMLMHRDYRHGQFTQIIRYDNRIEICNSGCSLKPDDMLGMKGSVTRNDTIARVCHDTKLAETKGSGIDRMWRKMVEAGLSRPTMESDRTASTFTIRLLLCHFFSEETLDWLKQFAAYELNDNQRTALVFLREVGALDAVAYRQLTGCNPKLVAKELAGIKDQELMIQKGRARGTYSVPSEKLLGTSQPRELMSQPTGLISQPQAVTGTPLAVNTTPLAANTTPPAANTIPLPRELEEDLAKLKGKAPAEVLSCLIVRLCSCCPMTNEMLQAYLKRGKVTINKLVAPLIGKRIDYLYPMMPHHPRQAYVAKVGVGIGS
jgi:ATP-dependent DNA helicase RecG